MKNRRGQVRFSLPSLGVAEQNAWIRLEGGKTADLLKLVDLSLSGLCFEMGPEAPAFDFSVPQKAMILLEDDSFPLTLRLINRRGNCVGALIETASPEWRKRVQKLLGPVEVGLQLHEIAPRYLEQRVPGQTLRWFQAGPSCDLFLWSDVAGKAVKAQLFYNWDTVEWTKEFGFRTGRLEQPPVEKSDLAYPMSKLYSLKVPPDPEVVSAARRIIASSHLPPEVKEIWGH